MSLDQRFDHVDEELAKLQAAVKTVKESVYALSVRQGRDVAFDNLRDLQCAVRGFVYPGIFDDLRSAEIGNHEAINRLDEVCRRLNIVRQSDVSRWTPRLETKG